MFLRYIFIGPPHKFLQVKGNLIVLPFCYVIQFVIVLADFPLSRLILIYLQNYFIYPTIYFIENVLIRFFLSFIYYFNLLNLLKKVNLIKL